MSTAAAAPIKRPDQISLNELTPQTGQLTRQTGPVAPPVGAGVMTGANDGPTPPPGGAAADIGTAFASLINEFLPPGTANVDTSVQVAAAMSKMLTSVGAAANQGIEAYNAARQEVYGKLVKVIQDGIRELAEIQNTSIWDVISLVAKVAVGLYLVLGGAGGEVVPGIGTTLGTASIVAGSVLLASAAEDATKMATGGHGIAGALILEFGGSQRAANDADWIVDIHILVAELAVMLAPGDAPSAATRVITLAAGLTDAACKAMVTIINYENAGHREQANRRKADEAELQSVVDQISAYLQQAIQQLMQSSKSRADIPQTLLATLHDSGNVVSRVRFAAV